jgi:hypothetical protein
MDYGTDEKYRCSRHQVPRRKRGDHAPLTDGWMTEIFYVMWIGIQ